MKSLWQLIGGVALVVGMLLGVERYVTAMDSRTQDTVVKTLQQYESAKKAEYLLHLLQTYEYRQQKAETPAEREKWRQKQKAIEEKIDKLSQ